METIKSPALILKRVPYQDKKQIINAYSESMGRIALVSSSIIEPLSTYHLSGQRRSGSLFSLKEAKLIQPHLHLRQDYTKMHVAFSICQALLQSQEEESPSSQLYLLVCRFLEALEHGDPQSILACFRIKLLYHEGLMQDQHPLLKIRSIQALTQLQLSVEEQEEAQRFFLADFPAPCYTSAQ